MPKRLPISTSSPPPFTIITLPLTLPDPLQITTTSQDLSTLLNMILATKQDVDFLKRDLARFGDEEPDEDAETDVDAAEEPEGVEALSLEEYGEELLEDHVGYVLHLRA